MVTFNRPSWMIPPPMGRKPRGWLGQFLCGLFTSHTPTRPAERRDILTGVPYIGRECRQCGKRLL